MHIEPADFLRVVTKLAKAAATPDPNGQILVTVGSFLADRRAQLTKEIEQIDQVLKEIAYYD